MGVRVLCIITPDLQTKGTRATVTGTLRDQALLSLERVIQFTINELSYSPGCDFHEQKTEDKSHTEKERVQMSQCPTGWEPVQDTMTTCHIPMTAVVQPCPLPSSSRSASPGSRGSCAEQYTTPCPSATSPRPAGGEQGAPVVHKALGQCVRVTTESARLVNHTSKGEESAD